MVAYRSLYLTLIILLFQSTSSAPVGESTTANHPFDPKNTRDPRRNPDARFDQSLSPNDHKFLGGYHEGKAQSLEAIGSRQHPGTPGQQVIEDNKKVFQQRAKLHEKHAGLPGPQLEENGKGDGE